MLRYAMAILTFLLITVQQTLIGWGLMPANASLTMELGLVAAVMLSARVVGWLAARAMGAQREIWPFNKLLTVLGLVWIGLGCWGLSLTMPRAVISGHVLNGVALVMLWWLIMRVTRLVPGPRFLKIGVVALTGLVLLLSSMNVLRPLVDMLFLTQVTLGGLTINIGNVLEAVLLLGLFGWMAFASATLLEHTLEEQDSLSPALQTLAVKVFKLVTLMLGALITLSAAGVNVTHLALFSGALGVGIGLSLKSISSNYISGLFLLIDKSIKPGDVISLDDITFGQVKALHSRYVVLRRRDGKEVLIPNETLMNQPVINWSYTNKAVRAEVEIPVSYDSNMEEVQAILREAVKTVPRVLSVPAPIIFIHRFDQSTVVFWVRFWSTDPEAGVNNLKGEVNMACWKALTEAGVEIPLPQRIIRMVEGSKKTGRKS